MRFRHGVESMLLWSYCNLWRCGWWR